MVSVSPLSTISDSCSGGAEGRVVALKPEIRRSSPKLKKTSLNALIVQLLSWSYQKFSNYALVKSNISLKIIVSN